jgi:drug/metabolite transporter (DMT)-like permease
LKEECFQEAKSGLEGLSMPKPRLVNYISLMVAAVGFGSIPVFSFYLSLYGVPSLQQGFFRSLFSVFYLCIGLGVLNRFRTFLLPRKHIFPFVLYGLFGISLGIIAYITAIAIGTPVIVAVSLTYLYPAITLILARVFLQEKLTVIRLIAVPLSIIGAIIVSLPLSVEILPVPLIGILLSIANGVFAALYVVMGRKWSGHEGYDAITTTFWGYAFSTLWMVPILFILHLFIVDVRVAGFFLLLPLEAWFLMLGFALFATAIPYALTNYGVKHIDASAASILLLIDPISAVIMGVVFLNQQIAFWQLIGAMLIFLATILIAIEPKLASTKGSEINLKNS